MFEYKVIKEVYNYSEQPHDYERFEKLLNDLAKEGWRVISSQAVSDSFTHLMCFATLEREIKQST